MHRHHRETYYVVDEGRILEFEKGTATARVPTAAEQQLAFRFSRFGKEKGVQLDEALRVKLAEAMTTVGGSGADPDSGQPGPGGTAGTPVPAGFTYLGQFVDHDLTLDRTQVGLGEPVPIEELLQGRSPTLDLDSLYGLGPHHASSARFYEPDGHLAMGTTLGVPFPPEFPPANTDQKGFDLPRAGETAGGTRADKRAALIPDARNDENLVVGQLHLAFIRFHNRVMDRLAERGVPEPLLFHAARDAVVKHYQWMLRTDFLPRIVDPEIVERVFTRGRRHFEVPGRTRPGDLPTMPIEFSVAAYRLGHSMVRGAYQWNSVFRAGGPGGIATLGALFRFSGTAGNLTPGPDDLSDLDDPNAGENLRLPSNWIADWRRLFDFGEAGREDLVVPEAESNVAKRIDTLLVDPLAALPAGTFDGRGRPVPTPVQRNLAFRNLTRAGMVELATGQQLAAQMCIEPLTEDQILRGDGGAVLDGLTPAEREQVVAHTPLWFYVLREAEVNERHPGSLTGVGGTLVAEVFHRAMEGSRISIVKHPGWRPSLPSRRPRQFTMTDLLLFAFEEDADLLNPLGQG
ncbi:peroxidase family protein [Streptomyces poonensis]|uniref:Myeloperoxidase n=1 Tax=Streptomyces poonensis TaxID=68255 RepID=A0A918Q3Y2_9ACTN|nr:heme peroxidase family protein [Streptomyces poonensis]GGZ32780.1 myeloperoxidase [Streptomyces poonensis]GLJ93154.1 myeloperoxidase [Streptomyces poonensis]